MSRCALCGFDDPGECFFENRPPECPLNSPKEMNRVANPPRDTDYIRHVVGSTSGDPWKRFIQYEFGNILMAIGAGDRKEITSTLYRVLESGTIWKKAMAELKKEEEHLGKEQRKRESIEKPKFFTGRREECIRVVLALGQRVCCYSGGEWRNRRCDCKYSGPLKSDVGGSEQTGCPELRTILHLLEQVPDEQWQQIMGDTNPGELFKQPAEPPKGSQ